MDLPAERVILPTRFGYIAQKKVCAPTLRYKVMCGNILPNGKESFIMTITSKLVIATSNHLAAWLDLFKITKGD